MAYSFGQLRTDAVNSIMLNLAEFGEDVTIGDVTVRALVEVKAEAAGKSVRSSDPFADEVELSEFEVLRAFVSRDTAFAGGSVPVRPAQGTPLRRSSSQDADGRPYAFFDVESEDVNSAAYLFRRMRVVAR